MSRMERRRRRWKIARPGRFIAFVLIIALCLGSLVHCALSRGGESGKDSDGKKTADEIGKENGEDPGNPGSEDGEESALPKNKGGTEETKALIAKAAEMQDYSRKTGEDAAPISAVDDNWLLLVNKTHPLAKDYAPDDLVTITNCVEGVGTAETRQMRKVAAEAMEALMAGAKEAGYEIKLRTAYRSYSYQENLFKDYANKHGQEEANRWSAKPGESEHQSGLCADVSSPSVGWQLSYEYGKKDDGKWLAEHCCEYGFIVRFPEGREEITGYRYEPWHIRYVGVPAACDIYGQKLTLEEYLGVVN